MNTVHIGKTIRFSHKQGGDVCYEIDLYDDGPENSATWRVTARFLGCKEKEIDLGCWITVLCIKGAYCVNVPLIERNFVM